MTRFFESTKSGMFTKEKYIITNDRLTGWIHTYKGSMPCPLFFQIWELLCQLWKMFNFNVLI